MCTILCAWYIYLSVHVYHVMCPVHVPWTHAQYSREMGAGEGWSNLLQCFTVTCVPRSLLGTHVSGVRVYHARCLIHIP